MRRTEKARWTHAARDPRRPAGNYGIQGVREGLLVTLIPRRGRSNALARRYKRRSDTFRTHLVYGRVWRAEGWPKGWKEGLIVPIVNSE